MVWFLLNIQFAESVTLTNISQLFNTQMFVNAKCICMHALKHSKLSQNFACRVANVAVHLFDLLEIHTNKECFYKNFRSNFFFVRSRMQ